jgi:hypothetical protein
MIQQTSRNIFTVASNNKANATLVGFCRVIICARAQNATPRAILHLIASYKLTRPKCKINKARFT